MSRVDDALGRELVEGVRVALAKALPMERLFGGYDLALGGRPLARELAVGDEGVVVAIARGAEPVVTVVFAADGQDYWRGGLRPDELEALGPAATPEGA